VKKNFENRLIFGKVKAYKTLCQFLGAPCIHLLSSETPFHYPLES